MWGGGSEMSLGYSTVQVLHSTYIVGWPTFAHQTTDTINIVLHASCCTFCFPPRRRSASPLCLLLAVAPNAFLTKIAEISWISSSVATAWLVFLSDPGCLGCLRCSQGAPNFQCSSPLRLPPLHGERGSQDDCSRHLTSEVETGPGG